MLTMKEVKEQRNLLEIQFDIEAENEGNAIIERDKICPIPRKKGGKRQLILDRWKY